MERDAIRHFLLYGALGAALGCTRGAEPGPGSGVIHLAERLAPDSVSVIEPPVPAPRHEWVFDEGVEGWNVVAGRIGAGTDLVIRAPRGRALVSSPDISLPLSSLHSIECRVRSTARVRFDLCWDEEGGDLEERFARPDWDPDEDPEYRTRSARLSATATPRDYRVLARDLWREDPEATTTTVARLYLAVVAESDAELAVERVGIVRREDIDPGPPRALVRETRYGIGMHAVRLAGGIESSASVTVPPDARLRFSLATTGREGPAAIEVQLAGEVVFRRDVEARWSAWEPVEVDLARFGGRGVEIVVRTEGDPRTRWLVGAPTIVGKWSGRNLLLYTIDTLRADLLEPYGYPGRTSPELSRLSRQGVLFEDCISTSAWTRPAVASLLTSRSAPAHGVVDEASTLADDIPTWPEMLRDRGFYTVAFFTNPNAGRSPRIDRGFDVVFETSDLVAFFREHGDATTSWNGSPSGTSEGIAVRFTEWIEGMAETPLFLYLHANDPHGPYKPRAPFAAIPGMEKGGRGARRRFARYARDVRAADYFLGEIVAVLRERGELDRTVIAVVADHGEEFLDHGGMGHGLSMWTETLRVPFVVRAPELSPGVHRGRVSLLDVVPTLMDLAGLEAPSELEGRSLVSELEDREVQFSPRPTFAHLITQPVRLDRDLMADRTFTGDIAVLQDQWKLVMRDYGPHAEGGTSLFDLRDDPAERRDVAELHPERVAEMSELARAWYGAVRTDRPIGDEVLEVQPEVLEQLRALGYLD